MYLPKPADLMIALLLCVVFAGLVPWAVASDCQSTTAALEQMEERFIELIDDGGESVLLRVKVADEVIERAAGFQHVCAETIDTTAVLFVFERANKQVFHMNNVHADLDIAFADQHGRVVDVQLMREEFSTGQKKLYPSQAEAKFALEVRAGFFKEHNITTANSRLKIDG